ncbi:hypothetical protein CR513_61500, partial [Mucuna pruriens]
MILVSKLMKVMFDIKILVTSKGQEIDVHLGDIMTKALMKSSLEFMKLKLDMPLQNSRRSV